MYSLLRVSLYLILNSIIGGFTWIYVFTITLVRFKIRSPSDLACILASKKQPFGTKIKIALKKCEKLNIFYKKTITKFVYKKKHTFEYFLVPERNIFSTKCVYITPTIQTSPLYGDIFLHKYVLYCRVYKDTVTLDTVRACNGFLYGSFYHGISFTLKTSQKQDLVRYCSSTIRSATY